MFRSFIKISDDPQWKRRAGGLVTSGGNFPPTAYKPSGRATVSNQVIAQRMTRQSTSVSENEDHVNNDLSKLKLVFLRICIFRSTTP